jgi:two-component system, sensor histidine kinase YesM
VKTKPEQAFSIGFSIFLAILAVAAVMVVLSSLVSLAVFAGTLEDFVESQSSEINKQIVMNYEGYINSVIETANYIQFASFNLDLKRDAAELGAIYRSNSDIKADVVSVYLFNGSGRQLIGPSMDFVIGNTVARKPWFSSALELKEVFHFNAEPQTSIAESRDENVIAVSKAVEYLSGGLTAEGVLLIELNHQAISDLARKSNLGQGGHLLILDDEGTLLYSSEPEPRVMTDRSHALAADLYLGGKRATIDGIDMALNVNTLVHTRWRIVTANNVNEINASRARLLGISALILIISIAVSVAAAGYVSLRISRPINRLKETMLRIEGGDLDAPIDLSGQREIALLSHSFTSMVARIRQLMASLVDEQKEKRKTELRALQNQINPHFLYNTLDSIVWLAEHQRSKDVITTVVSLARFFRISISKGQTFIPIEDEIAHVENYLTIQSIRYVDRFKHSVSLQPGMRGMKVMKLILQPIVENAIYHGVGDEDGHIAIRGRVEGGNIVFAVTNTGYGISEEKIREMYAIMAGGGEPSSVGIRNVYQRLKLYYGDRADIRITSVPDESTTVTLYIPIDPGQEN